MLILMALIYRHKGPHPETYKLSDEWTHEPILWAADEPVEHGHDSRPSTVGGGASGKW
ncbi:aa3-type cytochrome oxidase subunit CtaJ [Mycolicibacterium sp. XJ1819]